MAGEGGTPIPEGGRELPLDWLPFLTFSDPIVSLFMPNSILLTPFSSKKIRLSLSHIVPEISWSKVGQIVQQYLSFDDYLQRYSNIFFIDLISFWLLIFTKPYIPLGPFFVHELCPPTKKQVKSPPPRNMAASWKLCCVVLRYNKYMGAYSTGMFHAKHRQVS